MAGLNPKCGSQCGRKAREAQRSRASAAGCELGVVARTGHPGQRETPPVGAAVAVELLWGAAQTVGCSSVVERAGCSVGQREGVELGPVEQIGAR